MGQEFALDFPISANSRELPSELSPVRSQLKVGSDQNRQSGGDSGDSTCARKTAEE